MTRAVEMGYLLVFRVLSASILERTVHPVRGEHALFEASKTHTSTIYLTLTRARVVTEPFAPPDCGKWKENGIV